MLALLLLVACKPSLEEAPVVAAERYCARAVECNWKAADELDACVTDMNDTYFEEVVLIEQCEGIDRTGWAACLDAIDAVDCDSWSRGLEEITDPCQAVSVCEFLE